MSSSKQVYHFVSPEVRYPVTACISLGLLLGIVLSIASENVVFIVVQFILALVFFPYMIWLAAFQKFRVAQEGLYVTNLLNPFKPILIPWNTIQRISSEIRYYRIVGVEGSIKGSFQSSIERFDRFLDEFRNRGIAIDVKQQSMPVIAPVLPDSNYHTSLLSSSQTKLRTNPAWWVAVVLGGMFIPFGIVFLVVSAAEVIPGSVFVGLYMLFISLLMIIMGVWLVVFAFNNYLVIKTDGIDFPTTFRRNPLPWNNFAYARVVEVPLRHRNMQVIRIYARGKDEHIATIPVEAEAFQPVLREINDHQIPLLRETESLNNNK